MTTKSHIVQKNINHPLEDTLDIQQNTTQIDVVERQSQLSHHVEYDKKDGEIEQQLQEVYDLALEGYEQQTINSNTVEGKYKARVGEVAAEFLNTALGAIREKNLQKKYKDKHILDANKVNAIKDKNQITNNNLIISNRNEILKMLQKSQIIADNSTNIIDASSKKSQDKKTKPVS